MQIFSLPHGFTKESNELIGFGTAPKFGIFLAIWASFSYKLFSYKKRV